MVGLFILGIIAVASAVAWHLLLNDYILAALGATASSVIVFQLVAYIYTGYLDPFFIIAMVTTGIASFVIALIVGVFMKRLKRKDIIKEASQQENRGNRD